jgi:hypothetical protein
METTGVRTAIHPSASIVSPVVDLDGAVVSVGTITSSQNLRDGDPHAVTIGSCPRRLIPGAIVPRRRERLGA